MPGMVGNVDEITLLVCAGERTKNTSPGFFPFGILMTISCPRIATTIVSPSRLSYGTVTLNSFAGSNGSGNGTEAIGGAYAP